METVNLSKLLKGITSGWVAITSDYKKVVAVGETLKEVSSQVEGRSDIYLISASKNYRGFVTSV